MNEKVCNETYSSLRVRDILPQSYPFVFVDNVLDFDPLTKEVTAMKNFEQTEDFFKGHFPNNPIVPGVILIEAMSQSCILCGYLVNRDVYQVNDDDSYEHLTLKVDIKFRAKVLPNQQVILKSRLKEYINGVTIFNVKSIDLIGRTIASGIVTGYANPKQE